MSTPAAGSMPTGPLADHAVVGASDLERTIDFFAAFGFETRARHTIDEVAAFALYGLPGATTEAVLGVPGAQAGLIRVVQTPLPEPDRGNFHRGGHALDLYTTDIHASVAAATAWGARVGPIADYPFGPVHLTQAQAMGPDEVPLVFVGIDHRLPSVLDADPERLHSELHSVVASVDDIDAETLFWSDVVGLEKQSAFPIDVPAVSDFMMLPHHVPIRMSVLKGPGGTPPRFELLHFENTPGAMISGYPLLPGCTAVGLRDRSVDGVMERLRSGGAEVGEIVEVPGLQGGRDVAVHARTPGGVDLELRALVS